MHVIIIGAGIAGLSTALALKENDIEYSLYESGPNFNNIGSGIGLSINGMKQLKTLGLDKTITELGCDLTTHKIHNQRGRCIVTNNFEDLKIQYNVPSAALGIHRSILHNSLLNLLSSEHLHFNMKAVSITEDNALSKVHFDNKEIISGDVVILADGINSILRTQHFQSNPPVFSGATAWRGIIDSVPSFISKQQMNVFLGDEGKFAVCPISNNQCYWVLLSGNQKEHNPISRSSMLPFLKDKLSNYPSLVQKTLDISSEENILCHDLYYLSQMENIVKGNIVLIGDAAHGMMPNLAQGANQALEDAIILAQSLKEKGSTLGLIAYQHSRLERIHMVQEESYKMSKIELMTHPVLRFCRDTFMMIFSSIAKKKLFNKLYG